MVIGAITSGPDGNLWFTENIGNRIGRITTAGDITEYPLPIARRGVFWITTGQDGRLWYMEQAVSKIGRLTPTTIPPTVPLPPTILLTLAALAGVGSFQVARFGRRPQQRRGGPTSWSQTRT